MALDRTKTAQNAEKFVKTGKIVEAIGEYKKLADDNPRDMNTVNKLGDLYLRVNKNAEAIRTFLRIAEFYASDGFFLKAIAMYKKICKIDPSNMDCFEKLAALYMQQGLTIEAKAQYMQLADHFVKAAQFKKATAVLPKVLEIEPENIKVRLMLADLHTRSGQTDEATAEFIQVVRDLSAKGMADEALKVAQKALKGAPGHPDLMSLMLGLNRDTEKSPDELLASVVKMAKANGDNPRSQALLGEAYLSAGKMAEAEKVFRKLAAHGSQAPEVAAAIARFHLAREENEPAAEWVGRAVDGFTESGRTGEANACLDDFLRAFPDDRATLARKASVAEAAGDAAGQAAALLKLGEILVGASEVASATEVLNRVRALQPDNSRAGDLLQALERRSAASGVPRGGIPVAEAEPGESIAAEEMPDASMELDVEAEEQDAAYTGGSRIQDMPADEEDELEPEQEEFVSEHLTEAEVFMKYGLLEKAKQQLLTIIAKHPKHIDSHAKLKEIYYEEGNKDKAVEECLTLSAIFQGKDRADEAKEFLNEAIRIDPNNPRVKETASAGSAQPRAAAAPQAPPKERPAPPASIPVPELEIEEIAPEEPLQVEAEPAEAVAPASDEMEIEIDMSDGPAVEPQPPPARPAPPQAAPSRPIPEKIEEETPDDLGGLSLGDDDGAISIDLDVDSGGPMSAGAPAADPDPEKLGEVDFYIDQGLLEEAREVLFQLQKQFPTSEEVQRRFEKANRPSAEKPAPAPQAPAEEMTGLDLDVERAFGGKTVAMPAAPPPKVPRGTKATPVFRVETEAREPEGDFFDLAGELDKSLAEVQVAVDTQDQESLDGPGHSIDEIFKAFKKGVEQQVGSEDYDTHYNLGIAYKEMGLVDEAIGEFQFAAKDPARTVECCGILGLCFRDKGMPELALKWYNKALQIPGIGEHESTGLRYDIAEVHRETGDYRQALQFYTEVYGNDSTYRDVAAKIKEMRKLLG